jgi:hypothetical protein
MSIYNEIFKLTLNVIDLIKRAVRRQIGYLLRLEAPILHKDAESSKAMGLCLRWEPYQKSRVRSEISYGYSVKLT